LERSDVNLYVSTEKVRNDIGEFDIIQFIDGIRQLTLRIY